MFKRKGQSTLEYALIIAIVVAGLLVMQHYVKRGFAGRLKSASDDIGEQYDPSKYSGSYTVHQESTTRQIVDDRVSTTEHIADQVNRRTGQESIDAYTATEDLYSK